MPETRPTPETVALADQVEMRVSDRLSGEVRRYRTTVVDVAADTFCVAMPTERRVPVVLPDGATVVVCVWKGFANHVFPSRVMGNEGGDQPRIRLCLPSPEQVKRTPRRGYFRVETRLPARLRLMEDGEQVSLPAVMVDLSGGGCRLEVARRLRSGAAVLVDVDLPFPTDDKGHDRTRSLRQVPGMVRNVQPGEGRGGRRTPGSATHLTGIEFAQVENPTRNLLLRYVALRQREVLRQFSEAQASQRSPADARRIEEVQARLRQLEEELRAAGQEVPEPAAPPQPEAPEETPAVTQPSPQAAAPVLPPTGPPNGRTALLVEDEEELREMLAETLLHEGYRVAQAANGQDGLEVALTARPDVVITDLMMPRMNGWRLASGLREAGITAPVIIITGYMTQEGQEVLTNRDIAGFLSKPIDLDELISMVNGVFAAPQGRPVRVLVVDDEEEARLRISTTLTQAGFVVDVVGSGRPAVLHLDRFRPDLVLLDPGPPTLSGFDLAHRIRAKSSTANLPIIMLATDSSTEQVRRAIQLRINGWVVKPFTDQALIGRIRGVLRATAPA